MGERFDGTALAAAQEEVVFLRTRLAAAEERNRALRARLAALGECGRRDSDGGGHAAGPVGGGSAAHGSAHPTRREFVLWTPEGKAAAVVATNGGALEIGQSLARISAAEFVGIRCVRGAGVEDQAELNDDSAPAAPPPPADHEPRLAGLLRRPLGFGWGGSSGNLLGRDHDQGREEEPERTAHHARQRSADGGRGSSPPQNGDPDALALWEIVWKDGGGDGPLRRLSFEANNFGCAYVQNQLEAWSTAAASPSSPPVAAPGQGAAAATPPPATRVFLSPGQHTVALNAASSLLAADHASALASVLPARLRVVPWQLVYSSTRDGISLNTLYRRVAKHKSTLVVVRDTGGAIFGAFCAEAWHTHTRYFGTGESFVFQTHPKLVAYKWTRANNYFQFGAADSIAVGGGDHFALYLDNELQYGISGPCTTFGSPCLASRDEFEIVQVEVWGF